MSLSNRHVLVVGGAGYVGSVMVRMLLGGGCRTRVLDSFIYDHSLSLEGLFDEPGFSLVQGDLGDAQALDRALDGVTDVVLLAALVGDPISKKYPELTRRINVDASSSLFDALNGRGIQRFIFTSTCSNYGLRDTDEPAVEDDELKPLSLYAETKVELEKFIRSRHASTDHTSTILRIATAYGLSPRMRFDLTVNEFTYMLAQGRSLSVYDKETWRPYCHVRDIARAVMCVLEAPQDKIDGGVFNVGGEENNYTKEMIVQEVLRHLPGDVRYVEGGVDARNYRVSFERIKSELGFEPLYPVADYIPQLIAAVRAGLFRRVEEMRSYYGNYEVWI